jgi:hypothetical protein
VTDWERVRRLRAKGMDWRSIAEDPKVGYRAPSGISDPGRALKALYLARRSRAQRSGDPRRDPSSRPEESNWQRRERMGRPLPLLGIAVLLGGIIWISVALGYPAAGAVVPVFPYIVAFVIAGMAILAVASVGRLGSFASSWKKGVAAGLALGLALAGGTAVAAVSLGLPDLHPISSNGPGNGWGTASGNGLWLSGGKPVVFFYGSEACPYCSASSWAIYTALQAFGTWSGTGFAASSPSDVYPNTPEVALSGSSLSSSYISWDPHEDPNTQAISQPAVNPVENDYVTTYDSGGSIPFFVVGGLYIHTGTIVDPAALQGQTVQSVLSSLSAANPNDPVYSAIEAQVVFIEAYCAKICEKAGIAPPSAVTGTSQVQSILSQIS